MMAPFQHIYVFGAGALGSWLGARMTVPTTLIARGQHAVVMKRDGLRIQGREDDTVDVNVTSSLSALETNSLVLVTVKLSAMADVIAALKPCLRHDTVVAIVANGLSPDLDLATGLEHPVVRVIAGFGVTLDAPGVVSAWGGKAQFGFGPAEDRVAATLTATGLSIERVEDLNTVAWEKFAMNCVANPLAGLTGLRNCDLAAARFAGIRSKVVQEIAMLAATKGIVLPDHLLNSITKALSRSNNLNSMAQDMQLGRRTEIEGLNGLVVEMSSEAGIAAPVNQFLADSIRLRQSTSA
jgi:2-dehydropantoate 2-reductase